MGCGRFFGHCASMAENIYRRPTTCAAWGSRDHSPPAAGRPGDPDQVHQVPAGFRILLRPTSLCLNFRMCFHIILPHAPSPLRLRSRYIFCAVILAKTFPCALILLPVSIPLTGRPSLSSSGTLHVTGASIATLATMTKASVLSPSTSSTV